MKKPTPPHPLRLTKALTSTCPPPQPPSFNRSHSTADIDRLANRLCSQSRFKEAADLLYRHNPPLSALHIPNFLANTPPQTAVYSALLALCIRQRALGAGCHIHAHAAASGLTPSIFLSNQLINLYSKCGALPDARLVFDKMPHRDTCSYNTLITGYSTTGDLTDARIIFDMIPSQDDFSWSLIIAAYVRHGQPTEALDLYRQMQRGPPSNQFSLTSALSAVTAIPCLRCGKEIHCHILRAGFDSDIVTWRTFADMYAKCGSLHYARRVFDRTSGRNVVSWTMMIRRYFESGRLGEGFELYSEMLRFGVRPNGFTFAGVLDACSEQAMEGLGRQVHAHMLRAGFGLFSYSSSALVHMYSKCGNTEKARIVFEGLSEPDLVSWTSMISGYAQNGLPKEALRYFELMLRSGTRPDHVTFVGALSACAHAGLVDRGLEIFHSIKGEYGLVYTADHYACVVDLLSRSGRFREVEEIIDEMPMRPDKFLWASLLGGCRLHGNLSLGRRAAEALFQIEPGNAATYVTLANIYASAGMWDEVEKIRIVMEKKGVVKKPGSSWIEAKRRVHLFLVGDTSHPQSKEIYELLKKFYAKMKEEGYVANISSVLHDVEDEQKEHSVAHHSEKLAVAFGILVTPPGTTIKVFKNIRICGDCHTVIKLISRITKRVIIVRDSNRFHHFKNGICSCKDYW